MRVKGSAARVFGSGFRLYLESQRDLVSRLVMGITGVTIWVIDVISILSKSP